jgi:DNA (cytosine-5)-methyltransferase 3A
MLNYFDKRASNYNDGKINIRDKNGKSSTITASYVAPDISDNFIKCDRNGTLRRLTPIECSRLQTIPEWYKWECSDSQIYKLLGNGWTVKVIEHIFSFLQT